MIKGPRNKRQKGIIVEADSKKENAKQKEDTLLITDPDAHPKENTFLFPEDRDPDDESPMNFSIPLASSSPIKNRDFREPGESSSGAQGNNQIMEALISIQRSMEEREKKWSLQQKFREDVYEAELKRRDQ